MKEKYQVLVARVCNELLDEDIEVELARPEEEFGDFSTNIALQLAKRLGQNPRELAVKIAKALEEKLEGVKDVQVAGPGFINIMLTDEVMFAEAMGADGAISKKLKDQTVVSEYSDPNPFKVLHAGHLYTSLVGDAISNVLETAGAKVHRVNFGGDVGRHVAITMWAILDELGGEHPDKLHDIPKDKKLDWVSERYVRGTEAYETNEKAKQEITAINKRVYELHTNQDKDSPFAQIYWTCRQWSYDGFDELYERLGMVPFEKYYPESAVADKGLDAVKDGLGKGVFKESNRPVAIREGKKVELGTRSPIVFDGDSIGLHTRVFVNSEGLPTYEAKDLGLSLTKWEDYHFDKSFIITGNDIEQYMQVIIAAVKHFNPEASQRTIHRTHGQIKLEGGAKMSSRKGNILRASDILDAAFEASAVVGKEDPQTVLGAVRYAFLKNRIGGDIIYDPKESVSLEGNSGPYIQYALVRARSILRKSSEVKASEKSKDLEPQERSLARSISLYPEVFDAALSSYSPHHICNYLYELAQVFNRFYEKSRVIDDPRSPERVALVGAYEKVLSAGLKVLGMPTPEKM